MKSIAIMQPYFFPYIGYFQLIAAVEKFIYRDDVQFIRRGWVHRNRLLIEGKAKYLTIPCRKGSQHRTIDKVEHALDNGQKITRSYLLHQVESYYSKAPFFKNVFPLVQKVLSLASPKVIDISIKSITETCTYLGLIPPMERSSEIKYRKQGMVGELIDICKQYDANYYINALGGKQLYDKDEFSEHGIELKFLEPGEEIGYRQFDRPFVPRLSIIDVMMFNAPDRINEMLHQYRMI